MKDLSGIGTIQSQAAALGWQAGTFDFRKARSPGTDYFNPAIVRRPDGLWLITRRSKWAKDYDFGINDLFAFRLDENLSPHYGVKVNLNTHFEGEQFEDPRALIHNGRIFVSACTFIWSKRKWTGAHQIFCEVDRDWNCLSRFDPDYGGNGTNTGYNKQHNKNWLWFFKDGVPLMVHWADPHTVVPWVFPIQTIYPPYRATELPILAETWNHGEIRGGTNPALIGNEWWTFFHSSTPWTKTKRQYHMGAYAFEDKPPYRITKITTEPILSGSQKDRWHDGKPLVVFPCGNVFEKGSHLVTYGINDLDCGWVRIPHADLEAVCISLAVSRPESALPPEPECYQI